MGATSKHGENRGGSPRRTFEDRLWPINAVIFLLGCSVIGIILATGDFCAPEVLWESDWQRVATSGWGLLGGSILSMVILLAAVTLLSRVVVRRVELCVLVSLLVHLWLAAFLHSRQLPVPTDERPAARAGQDEPAVLPDYHWEPIDRPEIVQTFETPVATQSPQPEGARTGESRRAEREPLQEKLQPVEPESLHHPQVESSKVPRAEFVAPRREDLAAGGQVHRQEMKLRMESGEPIPMPEIKPGGPETPVQPGARATAQRQAADVPQALQAASDPVPDARRGPGTFSVARRLDRPQSAANLPESAIPQRYVGRPALDAMAESSLPIRVEGQPQQAPLDARSVRVDRQAEAPRLAQAEPPGAALEPLGNVTRFAGPPRRSQQLEPIVDMRALSSARRYSLTSLPQLATPIAETDTPQPGEGLPAGTDRADQPGRSTPMSISRSGVGHHAPQGGVDLGPGASAGGPGALAQTTGPALPPSSLSTDNLPAGTGSGGALEMASAGPGLLDAATGAGGLSRNPALSMGSSHRRARPQSDVVNEAPGRFVLGKSGGRPMLDGGVRESPRAAFQQRDPTRRGAQSAGGTDEAELAVERGIGFLVRHQFPDGHWSLDRFPQSGDAGYELAAPGEMNADTAATGLGLLAMLGAGYTHLDGPYQQPVRHGVYWLLKNQQPDGRLFTPQTDKSQYARFYGHAIAAIALCEAYGMTGDPNLLEPTQRAIRFILAAQHPTLGGWRYDSRVESDTSVSGWMLMALKSAQMAGLEIPAGAFQGVSTWLDSAQANDGARYVYNPNASESYTQREGKRPNLAMTAEGLLMRMYLGWRQDNPTLTLGVRHLAANTPEEGAAEQSRRDSYYWYYGTQVMFQIQGEPWKAWKERLEPMLVKEQDREGPLAGSWHPMQPVPDRWGQAGGRHYLTALNLLMLEVRYRHLPLYQLDKK